ncbi:MAG: hypothetical protein IPP16_07885 [Acidimicrobiaceae bacterium]|nr:hypothetical protein [Acidimicrobiaceae bacterium]
MSWLAPHANTENCYLTTVGRRTGRSHEVEIWFGVVGDTLYLISGNGPGADWTAAGGGSPVVSATRPDAHLLVTWSTLPNGAGSAN